MRIYINFFLYVCAFIGTFSSWFDFFLVDRLLRREQQRIPSLFSPPSFLQSECMEAIRVNIWYTTKIVLIEENTNKKENSFCGPPCTQTTVTNEWFINFWFSDGRHKLSFFPFVCYSYWTLLAFSSPWAREQPANPDDIWTLPSTPSPRKQSDLVL